MTGDSKLFHQTWPSSTSQLKKLITSLLDIIWAFELVATTLQLVIASYSHSPPPMLNNKKLYLTIKINLVKEIKDKKFEVYNSF